MTSSGTYDFNPALSDIVQSAYARIGVRRTALLAEHLKDAANEANYLLSEWSSLQPLLWKSELISQSLTEGTATYELPARVVMVLLAYIETGSGTAVQDRVVGPLSTTEYASITNKLTDGPPTSFWFNRLATPEITFWPVPDDGGPYTAYMRVVTQVEDASVPSGVTLDIPYRAIDAFVAGLSYRLSRIYAPQLEDKRKMDAMAAWNAFSGNDTENVPVFLAAGLSTYYR